MSRKEEIIAGLKRARRPIIETATQLPSEKQDEVFLGIWNIKHLIAHLIGWDYTNIEATRDIRSGVVPRVFEHWDSDWVKYNASLVQTHWHENMERLLRSIESSHNQLIENVQAIPKEDIEKDFGIRSPDGTNITVEWFLQFEIDDEGRHYQQIQDWLTKSDEVG